jgi:hypothetical protein
METLEPFDTDVVATGDSETTVPVGTLELWAYTVCAPSPAALNDVLACARDSPTRFGTTTISEAGALGDEVTVLGAAGSRSIAIQPSVVPVTPNASAARAAAERTRFDSSNGLKPNQQCVTWKYAPPGFDRLS